MTTRIEVTTGDLTEALTSFRLAVRVGRGQESREIADPETVAQVLHATLSRIAAERAPDAEPGDLTATLDGWRKAEQAATPGPWEADVIEELGDRPVVLLPVPGNDDAADLLFQADAPQATEADAEFIATARTAMPLLVAAVEAAQAKAAEWSAESEALEGGHRGLADHGADKLRTAMYARSVALKDCEGQLREAITRELAKGETP